MFVRTSQEVYLDKARQFMAKVVEQVKDLQFYTANGAKGGPIIMTQVTFASIVREFDLVILYTKQIFYCFAIMLHSK